EIRARGDQLQDPGNSIIFLMFLTIIGQQITFYGKRA
ncbi:unnamed protein product, partial [marine sediment metagenome]